MKHYDFRYIIIKNLIKPFYKKAGKYNSLFSYDEEKDDFILKPEKHEIDECRLSRMSKRYPCMKCFVRGDNPRIRLTKYWCRACKIPVCPLECYD